MGYKLENKEIKFSGKRISKIGTGKRGNVYKYHGQALKIYSENLDRSSVLDEDTARYLTSVSTDRILLPRKIIYYNNNFAGYSLKLVNRRGSKKKIIGAPKNEFIDNVRLLEDDVEILSNKGILLNGVTPSNVLYNGDIYLTDPSRYSLLDESDPSSLDDVNQYQLFTLLSELIVSELRKESVSNETINKFKDILSSKDMNDRSYNFFDEVISDNRDIKQLVKKM